jgi:hypothetical protein
MELEYQLAELIGTAQTNDQWKNAMSAYEVTAFRLTLDEKERIYKLLTESNEAITQQAYKHLDLAFAIRKEFGIQNNIIKPIESDGTPVITDFTDEAVTAENIAKVASTLILK